ncbi:phage major capsid protein [Mycobacterium riyadhense]|uniref:phage major capsid protein n=1 Tax=Mycobacterium riyadhense TaxID=486698 RepID=UPI00195C37D0|nr:phage major capsid protein [Mycobacterium riyadhense]
MTDSDIGRLTHSEAVRERDRLRTEARAILNRAGDGADLTGGDAERFDELTSRAEECQTRIQRLERAHELALAQVRSGGEGFATEGGAVGMHRIGEQRDPYVIDAEDRPPVDRQRDDAMRVLDRNVSDGLMAARGAEVVERLITSGAPQERSWVARYAAACADPDYLGAFARMVADPVNGASLFTPKQSEAWRVAAAVKAERAMSQTDTLGGFLIPTHLDPAILLSSSGSTNPLRQMARVVQTAGDVWHGVSSEGAEAHWYTEAEEVSDDSPTLAQPAVPNYRGSAWIPFSIEIEGDGAGFVTEVGKILMDSVEQLTAAAYVNGSGTGEPTGFIPALTAVPTHIVNGVGSEAVVAADAYALQSALPPRFQGNSAFAASLTEINVLRQAETTNGALKFPSLQDNPPMLCGRRMWEVSHMATVDAAVTATNYPLILGDWSQFLITDRIGSTVELVPHVFGPNRRPTGQRGFFCLFRTGSDVLVDNAFRLLKVETTA